MIDDLARLTDDVLRLRQQGRSLDAPALTLLLRCYGATERGDVRDVVEPALGAALEQPFEALPVMHRAGYLRMFVQALPVADDERVRAVIDSLVSSLEADWGTPSGVDARAAALDACLGAAAALDARAVVAPAIDELERLIGGTYKPGNGLLAELGGGAARGQLADHVRAASALLTAHTLTARLPYAMLAEELMQFARRSLWIGGAEHPFAVECDAVRVYCGLAALHAAAEYRDAAIVAGGADYRADAAALLTALSARLPGRAFECAEYALALDEWLGGS